MELPGSRIRWMFKDASRRFERIEIFITVYIWYFIFGKIVPNAEKILAHILTFSLFLYILYYYFNFIKIYFIKINFIYFY